MAFSINKIFLVGNVTRDPELRFTPSGKAVCTFSMATNRSIKENDSYKDIPTFHKIIVWGKIGEWLSKELVKGTLVSVEGRQENRIFESKGEKKYTSEVIAETVVPAKRKDKINSTAPTPAEQETTGEPAGDIPF